MNIIKWVWPQQNDRLFEAEDILCLGVFIQWNAMVEWNSGMEWWNRTVEWNGRIVRWNDNAPRSLSVTTYTYYVGDYATKIQKYRLHAKNSIKIILQSDL